MVRFSQSDETYNPAKSQEQQQGGRRTVGYIVQETSNLPARERAGMDIKIGFVGEQCILQRQRGTGQRPAVARNVRGVE